MLHDIVHDLIAEADKPLHLSGESSQRSSARADRPSYRRSHDGVELACGLVDLVVARLLPGRDDF